MKAVGVTLVLGVLVAGCGGGKAGSGGSGGKGGSGGLSGTGGGSAAGTGGGGAAGTGGGGAAGAAGSGGSGVDAATMDDARDSGADVPAAVCFCDPGTEDAGVGPPAACTASGLIDLDPASFSAVGVDINDLGDVLVGPHPDFWPSPTYIWSRRCGCRMNLVSPKPGTYFESVAAINAGASVAGTNFGTVGFVVHANVCRGPCLDLGAFESSSNSSKAFAINDLDQVVGAAERNLVSSSRPSRAFLWSAGSPLLDLGSLNGGNSTALAINNAGQVVGSSDVTGGGTHPFLWQAGSMRDLAALSPASATNTGKAVAINAAGQVVGVAAGHAFMWDVTLHDLGTLGGGSSAATGINSAGQVVGWSTTTSGATHAFIWEAGTMRDLGTLGGSTSIVTDGRHVINDAGQVIGSSTTAAGETHAVLWQAGTMRDLGTLGGLTSRAYGINTSGQVVGTSTTSSSSSSFHPFLFDPAGCPSRVSGASGRAPE